MQYNFDATQYDPSQGIELWPDNTWEKVIIEKHEAKPLSKDEKQGRLLLTLKSIEGPRAGKVAFLGLNLWIESQQAKEIAHRELSALTWVTLGANAGRLQFNDFSELHNIPFYILSKHQYDQQAKITRQDWGGFKDVNGNDPGKQGSGAGQPAPAFGGAPVGQPAPAAAPTAAPAPAAAPAFGQPAPAAQAPAGFGAPAPAAAPAAPAGFGAPPAAQAPVPGFGQPAQAPAAAPAFGAPQAGPAAAPGGFAPPAGQAPAGSPPWQNR